MGIVKDRCFRDPVHYTLEELKINVERDIASVMEDSLEAMVDNIQRRMELCIEQEGSHLEHIIH